MKKTIILILTMVMLTSCGQTSQEIIDTVKLCNDSGHDVFTPLIGDLKCSRRKIEDPTTIMDCIREYTNGIDEKYNNPDHVTNLREDEYSNVVKTCNDIFGEKETIE